MAETSIRIEAVALASVSAEASALDVSVEQAVAVVGGQQGVPGRQGPPGDAVEDVGDLTLIFENHLI